MSTGKYREQPNTLSQHLLVLDGLRGVAILLVICFHYFSYFRIGWVGVDLFFVLSGFLITGKLAETLTKRGYYLGFYLNRVLRILPLYYLTLIATFLVIPLATPQIVTSSYKVLIQSQLAYWLFYVNVIDALRGWPDNILLIHFWSLSCEMQFYLVWPFVIKKFYNNKTFWKFSLGLVIFALLFRMFLAPMVGNLFITRYATLFSRIDAFAFGALAYLGWSRLNRNKIIQQAKILSVFMVIVGFVCVSSTNFQWHFTDSFVNTIGLTINAIFFSSLLFVTVCGSEKFLSTFFSNPILTYIGKYSYSMYVFHLPVLILFTKANFLAAFLVPVAAFGATISISILSYHFYEILFLKVKRNIYL